MYFRNYEKSLKRNLLRREGKEEQPKLINEDRTRTRNWVHLYPFIQGFGNLNSITGYRQRENSITTLFRYCTQERSKGVFMGVICRINSPHTISCKFRFHLDYAVTIRLSVMRFAHQIV